MHLIKHRTSTGKLPTGSQKQAVPAYGEIGNRTVETARKRRDRTAAGRAGGVLHAAAHACMHDPIRPRLVSKFFFTQYPSHQIFEHTHGALNTITKNN